MSWRGAAKSVYVKLPCWETVFNLIQTGLEASPTSREGHGSRQAQQLSWLTQDCPIFSTENLTSQKTPQPWAQWTEVTPALEHWPFAPLRFTSSKDDE